MRLRGEPRGSTVIGGVLSVWDLDGKEPFHLEEKGVGFGKPSLGPDGARVAAVRVRWPQDQPGVETGKFEIVVWDIPTGRRRDDDPRLRGRRP